MRFIFVSFILTFLPIPPIISSIQAAPTSTQSIVMYQLKQKAERHEEEGDYDKAIQTWESPKSYYQQNDSIHQYIVSLLEQARLSTYLDQWEACLQYVNTGLLASSSYTNMPDTLTARLLYQKGSALAYTEQYEAALATLQEAKAFIHQKNTALYISLLSVEGFAHFHLGHFLTMKKQLEEAVQLIANNKNLQKKELLSLRIPIQDLLGVAYDALGQYNHSLQNAEQTLALVEQDTTLEQQLIADLNHNLGTAYQTKGNDALAEIHYNKALFYYKKDYPKHHKNVITTVLNKVATYKSMNKIQAGLTELLAFVHDSTILQHLKQEQTPNLIEVYTKIAVSYKKLNNDSLAQDYLQKALVLALQKKHHLPIIYRSMADIAYDRQKYAVALTYLHQAIATTQSKQTQAYKNKYHTYKTMGNVWMAQQNYTKALTAYQQAFFNLSPNFTDTLIFNHPSLNNISAEPVFLELLQQKAIALYHQYKEDTILLVHALRTSELACEVIDHMRHSYQLETTKQQLASQAIPIYEQAITTALTLYEQTGHPVYQEKAFYFSEKGKGTILLEQIQEKKAKKIVSALPDSLLELETQLQQDRWFFRKQLINEQQKQTSKQNTLKQGTWKRTLGETERALNQLKQTLEQQYPTYYQLKYATNYTTISDMQSILSQLDQENTSPHTVLAYFVGDQNTYLFYITADTVTTHRIVNSSDLRTLIEELCGLIKNPKTSINVYTSLVHEAYLQLVAPIAAFLQKQSTLIIIPDDHISYLPFEVLLSQAVDKISSMVNPRLFSYLLNNHPISYAYSATLWAQQMQPKSTSDTSSLLYNYVGFAPAFNIELNRVVDHTRNCTDGSYGTLKHNIEEVKIIREIIGGRHYINMAANKENFVTVAPHAQTIHLATHACVNDQQPMFNAIQFKTKPLYTYELFHLNLSKVELVTLSACETGKGELSKGEGVLSLSRGFTHAGCPSLVHSQWSADDKAAKFVMEKMYTYLKDGLSKSQALRQAKLDYLNNEDIVSKKLHPFYWANFVLSGNIKPIKFVNQDSCWNIEWWMIMIACTCLGLLLFFIQIRR